MIYDPDLDRWTGPSDATIRLACADAARNQLPKQPDAVSKNGNKYDIKNVYRILEFAQPIANPPKKAIDRIIIFEVIPGYSIAEAVSMLDSIAKRENCGKNLEYKLDGVKIRLEKFQLEDDADSDKQLEVRFPRGTEKEFYYFSKMILGSNHEEYHGPVNGKGSANIPGTRQINPIIFVR
ncbi:MAG: hypothetical protein NT129_01625 [Candidatus Aenigmarchaeota archaeon]|nr:hypothetical protein [Candidatus Aenigmarchaeota archaeon]